MLFIVARIAGRDEGVRKGTRSSSVDFFSVGTSLNENNDIFNRQKAHVRVLFTEIYLFIFSDFLYFSRTL